MSGGHLLSRLFGRPRRPRSVTVGSWTRIGQDVVLGERVRLGDWSHIGDGSRIGEDCVFGPWARVGSNVTLGARVRLGSHIRGGGVRLPLRFDPEDFPVLDFDCDPGSFLRWPERTHTLTPRPGYALAWGSGHAARASLPELPVADHLRLLYWGDCDSHGYAILNGLRRDLPHLRPVGMGTETVQSHEGALIPEADPERIETSMPFLGPDEAMARMLLLGRRARLEQERVRVPEADLFPS